MHLAIVRKRYSPFGGAERFVATAVERLVARGTRVTIVAEEWEGDHSSGCEKALVGRAGLTRAGRHRHFQSRAEAVVAKGSFDLVQSHERILGADLFRVGDGVHAAWFDRLRKERSSWRAHWMAFDPMHRMVLETERRMARSDTIFVANSQMIAREIAEWLHVPAHRIRVIENGVDLDKFRPATADEKKAARERLSIPLDVPLVTYVGSGFARKGVWQLVEALALPEARNIHALIVGRDSRANQLMSRIHQLGLANRIVVTGGLQDVRPALAAADFFALPSLYEPMPNAALEAIASGLPVVTTHDTGIAEAIVGAGAGCASTREPASIASAFNTVLANQESMRAAVLQLRHRYDLGAATDRWLDLYGTLR